MSWHFQEPAEEGLAAHRSCLEQLKGSLRTALIQVKKGAGQDGALQHIEKTLQGQTCRFGSQIFGFKQAAVTLLTLLKLLPESPEPRVIMQLVEQLARQDFGILSSFISDCAEALGALRHRPLKLSAFQRTDQRCKERLPGSEQAGLPDKSGLALDLGASSRFLRCGQGLAQLARSCAHFGPEENLHVALLQLLTSTATWAEAEPLLLACLEASRNLRPQALSLALQHELSLALAPVLRAGLRSSNSSLRGAAAELAEFCVARLQAPALCPQLPGLLEVLLDGAEEERLSLLAAVERSLGESLRPLLAAGNLPWKALEGPSCRHLVPLLRWLDLSKAPALARTCAQMDLSSARAQLEVTNLGLEATLEVLLLNRPLAQQLQAQGEKLTLSLMAAPHEGRTWRLLLRCLHLFGEVGFLQKLLAGSEGPRRLAVWAALAAKLRGFQSAVPPEEARALGRFLETFPELSKDPELSPLVLSYTLALLFAPSSHLANTAPAPKAPRGAGEGTTEVLRSSPFCSSQALLALPSCALPRRGRRGAQRPRRSRVPPQPQPPGEVLQPLPCVFCKASQGVTRQGRPQCACGAELLTLEWSLLDAPLLDIWATRQVLKPQELLRIMARLRSQLGRSSETAVCLLEPTDSQPAAKKEDERWALGWAILGLCTCSSADFLRANAEEIRNFFPMEMPRTRHWEATAGNCHSALLQCANLVFQGSAEWRKRLGEAESPAALAQYGRDQVPALLEQASGLAGKVDRRALQRLFGLSMLASSSLEQLPGDIYLRLLGRYKDVQATSLYQLLLKGSVPERVRELLPKMVPPLVLKQSMEGIQDLMMLLDEESIPSFFTPLLPYVLSDIAEEPAIRLTGALTFIMEKVYDCKVTINSLYDANLGKVLVRILWNSSSRSPDAALRHASATLDRIAEVLRGRQDKKRSAPEAPADKKRRKGDKSVIDVNEASRAGVSSEALGLAERGFLHALDILQIVASERQENPKWQEYHHLMKDPSQALDHGRFFRSAALLLEILGDEVHRFAPKVLEFLQCSSHAESLKCWRPFLRAGAVRLRALVPAVVSDLLHLGQRMKELDLGKPHQESLELVSSLVLEAKATPEVLLSLPPLPQSLQGTRHQVEKMLGAKSGSQRFEEMAKHMETAPHQAVRRAILEGLQHLLTQQRQASPNPIAQLPGATLTRLMRAVLKFLLESSASPGNQLLCGQVLGALGAIDPARFAGQVLVERHNSKDHRSPKGDEELAKSVLEDFLAPQLTRSAFAFAAQEIFKVLKKSGKDHSVLAKIPREDVREALRPYMTSEYQSLSGVLSQGPPSLEGALAEVPSLLPPDRRPLFEACLPPVAASPALAQFLLHHVALPDLLHHAEVPRLKLWAQNLAKLLNFQGDADSKQSTTAQAVFSLLDDLFHRQEQVRSMPSVRPGDEMWKTRQNDRLMALVEPFSNRLVLTCAMRCGAHARSLQFLEMELIEQASAKKMNIFDEGRLEESDCELLQTIYRELGEPDGVVGAIRIGPSARIRTAELELKGKWSEVQGLCEQRALVPSERPEALCGLVDCAQAMRRFESSLQLIRGIEQELPQLTERLRPRSVEAAWQLSSWDRLDEALQAPSAVQEHADFQVQLGQVLLKLHQKEKPKMQQLIQETTLEVTRQAALAVRDSYVRAYPHLLRLHVLCDLDWLSRQEPKEVSKKSVAQNLLARCDLATATFSAQKTLLGPLRIALQDLELVDEAKVLGLAFSRLCRKHKETASMEHPDTSFALAPAKLMESAQLEWGKILYAGGARHDALHHMRQLAPRSARARLLGARWATEASLLLPRSAEAEFREARDRLEDEAAFFYHASYLDYLLKGQISDAAGSHSKRARMESSPFDRKNLVVFTFRGYLQALQRGTKRLHFILNRLLQLAWECCEVDFYKTEMAQEFSSQARKLPPWMWYSVLSQLISRALQPDLQAIFLDIIKDVVKAYPQQSGWHLMQLLKSSDKLNHYDLGQKIVYQCGKEKRELHPLLSKRCAIAEDLIALAGCPGDSVQLGKSFPRLAGQSSFSNDKWMVLVPVTSQMTATIPRMDGPSQIKQGTNFFPAEILSEKCFEHVEVFRSKERPKKLTFLGVDGRSYPFLCKAEKRGDLRKDSRLMEFATMVNQLLAKSPDANRRNLAVRTFQVVILSEKCGLIEWVPNTKGLRNVIDELWKSRKTPRQGLNEIKDLFDRSKDLYETFTRQVLPRHPPILHRWFMQCGDPSVWFARRMLFSQSQALWCMLGYLLGLGDRHCENILIDTESGRMVHVDFDCLFGKGMLLERPEMVPFRLTQNCVAAMGVTGVEGVFRTCCEVTMEVLRDKGNTQTLLSVLHVFVADPLLEITRKPAKEANPEDHRVQIARDTIGDVEKKLKGMLNVGAAVASDAKDTRESVLSKDERMRSLLGRDRGVGLSVKGQVDELIKAATCKRNLSEMYVGWQPWL